MLAAMTTPVSPAVPNLTRWGLSPDADLTYRALVGAGASPWQYLARELGFGRHRLTSALDELVACSLVRVDPSPAGARWLACSVSAALAVVRRRRFPQADPWRSARQYIAETAGLGLPEHPEISSARIRRLAASDVRHRIRELVAIERYEHLALQPEESFSADVVAAALPLDQSLVDRGVRLRVIGRPPADGDTLCAASEQLAKVGGDYRELDHIPIKMMIFDRRVMLIPGGLERGDGVWEIAEPSIMEAALAAYTRLWLAARDPRRRGVSPIMLTHRERAITAALAQGMTDEQAAAHLKISPRTVGYAMHGLMERLKVENRFQLGLILGATATVALPGEESEAGHENACED